MKSSKCLVFSKLKFSLDFVIDARNYYKTRAILNGVFFGTNRHSLEKSFKIIINQSTSITNIMAIKNYKDVQAFITSVMEENKVEGAPPPKSPHKAFWATMSYDDFTKGFVPGVKDPLSGKPVTILKIGNSAKSNLILALKGEGRLFDSQAGAFGRMPANGQAPFSEIQINEIAEWIDEGCPEF